MAKVILASRSPRRKEILERMGITFKSMVADVNEKVSKKEPGPMVEDLARQKVERIAEIIKGDDGDIDNKIIIIGADTMVFHKGNPLGKPIDEEDAIRMLKEISDDVHEVYTGVYIIIIESGNIVNRISFANQTRVWVNKLSKKQIIDYIASGEAMDKAGAYGIQGRFGIFIKKIEGDYYNVVGLPIAEIYEKLLEVGIDLLNL